MPNYRRSRTKGGTFFFTVVTHHRLPIFNNTKYIRTFRIITSEMINELPFIEVACVVLHDHIHSIWTLPDYDNDFSKRWGIIKARFTKHLHIDGFEGQVWQKRFWEHTIKDDSDLNAHIDYIHYNSVKHSYVDKVIDWPYSSFRRYVDEGKYPNDCGADVVIEELVEHGE